MRCHTDDGLQMPERGYDAKTKMRRKRRQATPLTGLAIGVKIQLRIGTQTLAFRLVLLGSSELGVADDRSQ